MPSTPLNFSCPKRGSHLSSRDEEATAVHAILCAPLNSLSLLAFTIAFAFAMGVLVGWLSARARQTALEVALARERAVHAERVKAFEDTRAAMRAEFDSLSRDALERNTREFLTLADTRFSQARTEATADVDARRQAI